MNETGAFLENLAYFEPIRKIDEMTPSERAKALSEGRAADRMPVSIMADLTTPAMIGSCLRECDETPRGRADVQIAVYRLFGVDGIGLFYGLNSLAIRLGGEYIVSDHMNPSLKRPVLTDLKKVDSLDWDDIRLENDPLAWKPFEAMKIIRDEVGDEVGLAMNFTSPFTEASGVTGVETLLRGMLREPDRVDDLLQRATDVLVRLAEPFIQEGFEICTSDPVASPTVISPRLYRRFAKKYEKQFASRIEALQGKPLHFHMCGNSTKILKDIAEIGYKAYSLDNMVDLSDAKAAIGDQLQLEGNVDPVRVMAQEAPPAIEEAVKSCYRKAWDSPGGFVIHSGCDMPHGTPRENIFQYLKTAKACARDQYLGRTGQKSGDFIWDS